MNFETVTDVRRSGFAGFQSIGSLRESRLAAVPREHGVYVVLRPDTSPPKLLSASPAGHYRGRDPTISREELLAAWVERSCVLYIGKAGAEGGQATLQSRLVDYVRHGYGAPAAHWGGRAIWQLAGAPDLLVAWRTTAPEESRAAERALIHEFVARYGRRPFANRTG